MLRKRVASVLVQREEKDDAPKYPKTVARKGVSFLSWITVVVVGGMMISIPPTNDYLLLWTSNSLLLSTLCFNVHNEGNITSDPLARLAKIRDDVSLFGSSLQSTGISADRISLVWALDQAPNPKRFEKTLASLPQTQNPKQLYIYCGSTACLLAAKSATKDYKGAVELTRLSVPDLAQGTELQEWGDFHVLAKLMAMHHYKQHLQAAMQLAVAWKYGGSILEPGYVVTTIPTKDAICSGKAHGFSMLHSSAPKSKVIESLMKELLQVYSWNILKTIDVTTKDEDMPTSPTNWPITIDWNEILSKLKVSSFDACSSTEVDYQDSSGTHFFGSLGYDDRRRQLMSKRIRTMNIGDETQGLAGIQMLPRVDAFVERDVLHQAKFATPSLFNNATDKIVMFLNAWYGIPAMIWPPPDFLEPVTLAMHFQDRMYNKILELPNDSKLVGEMLDGRLDHRTVELRDGSKRNMTMAAYLQRHRPIGARDTKTLDYFSSHGIPAFFSACMTMTLGLPQSSTKDSVLIIDALNQAQLEKVVPVDVLRAATVLTQDLVGPLADTSISRYLYSFYRLLLYPRAKLIITSRLHVALPAVALGTPVVFMHNEKLPGGGGHRLDGLDNFMHAVRGTVPPPCFDWRNPPPNPLPKDFIKHRNRLKQMAICHKGVSDSARKFGIVPLGWDAGDEWSICSSQHVVQADAIRIATTLDENYLDQIFPSWINALARSNGNRTLELYILIVGLSEKQRCLVRTVALNLLPRTPVFTIPVDLSEFETHYFNKGPHISVSTQARLRLPSILPCIDKIAWIDLDAFVVKSLQEFWTRPVAECGITARNDNVLYLNVIELPGGLKWNDLYGYNFNAGVLLLSLATLRQNKFEDKIVQHWGIDLGFNDQVVLNMACNGTHGILNETMNMLMTADFSKSRNPNKNWVTNMYYPGPAEWVIVHFTSSKKPWSQRKLTNLPHFIKVWEDYKLSFVEVLDQS